MCVQSTATQDLVPRDVRGTAKASVKRHVLSGPGSRVLSDALVALRLGPNAVCQPVIGTLLGPSEYLA